MPGFPVHHQIKLMSIELVMLSNHLILCRPLLLLPSIFPSIRVFSKESDLCIRLLKYWSFRFSISPSNVYSALISFRIDWFVLLAVEGTKSLLLHHSSKASIRQHSAFFIVQFSHPYMSTGNTIVLTIWTYADKGLYSQSYGTMYGCEIWTIKKDDRQRFDVFELWCWKRLLLVTWNKKTKPVNLKGNQP